MYSDAAEIVPQVMFVDDSSKPVVTDNGKMGLVKSNKEPREFQTFLLALDLPAPTAHDSPEGRVAVCIARTHDHDPEYLGDLEECLFDVVVYYLCASLSPEQQKRALLEYVKNLGPANEVSREVCCIMLLESPNSVTLTGTFDDFLALCVEHQLCEQLADFIQSWLPYSYRLDPGAGSRIADFFSKATALTETALQSMSTQTAQPGKSLLSGDGTEQGNRRKIILLVFQKIFSLSTHFWELQTEDGKGVDTTSITHQLNVLTRRPFTQNTMRERLSLAVPTPGLFFGCLFV